MPYRDPPALLREPPPTLDAARERRLLLPLLDNLRVASPCAQSWEEMAGDERVRFCWRCRKNVYNLTAMTREEAETLVFAREGAMCVRFYRRSDGTVLTSDCPPGRRRALRLRRLLGGAVAMLLAVLGVQYESPPPPPVPPPAPPPRQRLPDPPEPTWHDRGWVSGATAFGPDSPITGFEMLDRRVDGWTESWTTGEEPPKR